MDATFHAAQDLIYTLQNPEPTRPLSKLGNGNKGELKKIAKISRKSTPPSSDYEGASQGDSPIETQKGEPRPHGEYG